MASWQTNDLMLHARALGSTPNRPDDLLPSVLLTLAFPGLAAYCVIKLRGGPGLFSKLYYSVLVAMMALFIGFAVRAGLSNTDPSNWSAVPFQTEQIFLMIGHVSMLEAPLMLTRSLAIPELDLRHRPVIIFTWVLRVLYLAALALSIYSFLLLPDPSNLAFTPQTSQSQFDLASRLRLAANAFTFGGPFVSMLVAIVTYYIDRSEVVPSALTILMNLLLTVVGSYGFVIVAVTKDDSPLVTSKLYFYFTYGIFLAIVAIMLLAVSPELLWSTLDEKGKDILPYFMIF